MNPEVDKGIWQDMHASMRENAQILRALSRYGVDQETEEKINRVVETIENFCDKYSSDADPQYFIDNMPDELLKDSGSVMIACALGKEIATKYPLVVTKSHVISIHNPELN